MPYGNSKLTCGKGLVRFKARLDLIIRVVFEILVKKVVNKVDARPKKSQAHHNPEYFAEERAFVAFNHQHLVEVRTEVCVTENMAGN